MTKDEIATAGDIDLKFLKRAADAINGATHDLQDGADAQELSRYHAETMRLIYKYGFDAVVKVIINCRNQALREGKL